jgi:nicotinamide-nucleotide adenylyltransferase
MADIPSRIAQMKALLPKIETALKSFASSSEPFRVINTISLHSRQAQIPDAKYAPRLPAHPNTLFILDSSYNPPSRAHLALASSCLSAAPQTPKPDGDDHRLLLLFSTQNADKAPSPASFVQRIAMMILFASDLQEHLVKSSVAAAPVDVDIGLTTSPYYTDKSAAISATQPPPYPSRPAHVHLLGYDTLTRFLAPKYYPNFSPPLSALAPFFGNGHRLLVLLRPNSSSDNAVTGDTEDQQRAYISKLAEGSLETEGFKREWSSQISILKGHDVAAAEGISSTAVRRASKMHDWDEVSRMCTPAVAEWLREMRLYEEDDRGAKTA